MGVVEDLLAEFQLSDGSHYRVEYNKGDEIHLHVDSIRIDSDPEEFADFAEVITEARDELIEIKNLDEDVVPEYSESGNEEQKAETASSEK